MIIKKVTIHDTFGGEEPARITYYFCGIPLYTKQVGYKANAYNPPIPNPNDR